MPSHFWRITNRIKSLKVSLVLLFTHCSLSAVTHAPFHASMLRPASQAGPMHEAAGVGKLVNAALLSLINEAVWMYAVLPSSRVNSAPLVCRHDWVTREAGHVRLVGRDWGGGDVPVYLYCPAFSVKCFSRCLIQACMLAGRPSHWAHLAPSARAER